MYTVDDILEYIQNFAPVKKCRERVYLDPRNYLMAVLHYKFNISENALHHIFRIDRSTINYNKKTAYYMMEQSDPSFMRNTLEVRQKFPYEIPSVERNKTYYKQSYSYRVGFDKDTYKKVQSYCKAHGKHPSIMLSQIICKEIKLWEK